MVAGDTTSVRGGTYVEASTIAFARSGTPSAPIKLLGYPGEKAIITWASKSDANHLFTIDTRGSGSIAGSSLLGLAVLLLRSSRRRTNPVGASGT